MWSSQLLRALLAVPGACMQSLADYNAWYRLTLMARPPADYYGSAQGEPCITSAAAAGATSAVADGDDQQHHPASLSSTNAGGVRTAGGSAFGIPATNGQGHGSLAASGVGTAVPGSSMYGSYHDGSGSGSGSQGWLAEGRRVAWAPLRAQLADLVLSPRLQSDDGAGSADRGDEGV